MSTTTAVCRTPLAAELAAARSRTDFLFRILRPEALYARPIGERHRMIFYVGHLEAFDWNMICRRGLDRESFHPEFDRLFEFGIDPAEGSLPTDTESDWPSVDEVRSYNRRVRAQLDTAIEHAPEQIVRAAIEHRWMHAETLAYLLHNLPYKHKTSPGTDGPAETWTKTSPGADGPAENGIRGIGDAPSGDSGGRIGSTCVPVECPPIPSDPALIEIPAGEATLGQRREEFGWDNEFDEHLRRVPAFAIGKYKVTNADYLRFVEAGAEPPFFWTGQAGAWFYRGMFRLFPLPGDWPVYVTYEEAQAYARWRGAELPTEAEFHRAAYGTPEGAERPYPWGHQAPSADRGNFDFAQWDPLAVTANPAGDSAWGVSQLLGNGWEWTSTPFAPFAGFRAFDFYPRYSAAFFDDDHFVMKGGSPQTAQCLLRRSFRNWFRRRYPYVYGTFRLVQR
jgi:formylglycine-generating enzyme required for sulfatase activity